MRPEPLGPDRNSARPGRRPSTEAGLTLVELMMVISLLSLFLGIGLGMFATLNPGERAAYGLVQNLLRTAHNSAVARTAPARVRIDPAAGTLVAEGMEVIGTWHFETSRLEGAFDLVGVPMGMADPEIVEDGFQGRGLSFTQMPRGSSVQFQVQDDPAFDVRSGFSIDVAARLDELRGAVIFDLGKTVVAQVTHNGGIVAYFVAESTDKLGRRSPGVKLRLDTRPGVLRVGHWTRLSIVYDRRRFAILADGVELTSLYVDVPVWRVDHPLVLSGGPSTFPGTLDNLVISAVAGEEVVALPDGVRFPAGTPKIVQFAPGGALDPAVHDSPVRIGLEFDSGRTDWIQVNLYGTVE